MNSKVDIKGDVGFSIGLNHGAIIVNNNYGGGSGGGDEPPIDPELKRAIHELLRTCDPIGQRKLIENIAEEYYGTLIFKSLTVQQVKVLFGFAEDIANAITKAVADQKRSIAREEDEFQKEYGMLASAPARAALKLLVEQNLTTKQVARAWRSGMLRFEDDGQFVISQSRVEKALGLFMFSLGVIFAIPAFFTVPVLETFVPGGVTALGKAQAFTIIGMSLSISVLSFWTGTNILAPHHIISRVVKHLDKVNELLRARK
jgi:hypothetical protein